MVDWNRVRADFPAANKGVYFISAGMSPLPKPVFDRVVSEYHKIYDGGDVSWEADLRTNKGIRGKVGTIINANADDVAFVVNTSTAISLLALSLKNEFKDGFNVISMMDEFPSTTVPFEYQGIEMKYVEPIDARYSIDSILRLIDGDTKAVVTSYVQYATGFRQNLKGLGAELKKRDILFLVNSTQGYPYFPLDVKGMKIDALSASLHKWGMAGQIGAIFYTSPEFRKKFPTPIAGWQSVIPDEGDFIYTKKNGEIKLLASSDQYMCGSINLQAINAYEAALDYQMSIGYENIRKRIFELSDYLIDCLNRLNVKIASPIQNYDERSAAISFNLGENTRGCVCYLQGKRIYVSYRNKNIRVSLNMFNDEGDIDLLMKEISNYLNF